VTDSTSAPRPEVLELTAELEAKIMRQLVSEWEHYNWMLFGSTMRPPAFELSTGRVRLGEWRPHERVIALSRALVFDGPWAETVEVLKHEMAHQFVVEVLGREEEDPHGPTFRRACEARGIDPAGIHRGGEAAPSEHDRVIARVRKLLALAESSNQHEAELAAVMAQRLMMKFNLQVQREGRSSAEACGSRWLGEPTGRVQLYHRVLAAILIDHFFVLGIWLPVYRPREGMSGTVLEICGRPENLEMAEFVHDFLLRTIERLWIEHKRAQGIRSDRDRRNFYAGALTGFRDKLRTQRKAAAAEGLVWVGGAAEQDYFEKRHPRTRSTTTTSRSSRGGYEEGKQAGRGIVLSQPVTGGSSGGKPLAITGKVS